MKINHLLLAASLLAMAACSENALEEVVNLPDDGITNTVDDADVVPGWVRVRLAEQAPELRSGVAARAGELSTGNTELDDVLASYGIVEVRRTFPDGGRFEQRRRDAGLHLWYDIRYAENAPVTRAMNDLSSLPMIEVAEPLYKEYIDEDVILPDGGFSDMLRALESVAPRPTEHPFNDPDLYLQWHYNNIGPNEASAESVEGMDVNLYAAWEIERGHPDVIVAVVDHAIDIDHEDLWRNIWVNPNETARTGRDDDNNGYVDDVHGFNFLYGTSEFDTSNGADHGTHVGGTIGAMNDNGLGGGGVAGGDADNRGVSLMVCQIMAKDVDGNTVSASKGAEALVYAADNGAVISNYSWSRGSSQTALQAAIKYFRENAGKDENGNQIGPMAGGLIICAAGNNGDDVKIYPAGYTDDVLAVSNISYKYKRASNSNYGDWVHIAAPGYKVWSTSVNNTYVYKSGTSMSAPHVSGVAALMVSKYGVGKTGLTVDMLIQMLYDSTEKGFLYEYNPKYEDGERLGCGMVDAYKALSFTDEDIEYYRQLTANR